MSGKKSPPSAPGLLSLFRPYIGWIVLVIILTLAGNALNLTIPRMIASAIDSYANPGFRIEETIGVFLVTVIAISLLLYLQSIVQVMLSERVAKNLRSTLMARIATQDTEYIQKTTPEKLLTYVTSDVDAVKGFVSQAMSSIISSVFLITGALVLLITINWRLTLAVTTVLPIIGGIFYVILSRVRKLFRANQEAIDALNRNINNNIVASSLIRILNSQSYEYDKFLLSSGRSLDIGMQILRYFAFMMPSIALLSSLATLIILALGGHYVILGTMTMGDFVAFNGYLAVLIFPILVIGFMSNVIAQASASYGRIQEVLSLFFFGGGRIQDGDHRSDGRRKNSAPLDHDGHHHTNFWEYFL